MALDLIVVLVTAFWLLRDHAVLERSLIANMPATWRPHAEFVIDAAIVVVGGYVRAQVSLALLVGTSPASAASSSGFRFPWSSPSPPGVSS